MKELTQQLYDFYKSIRSPQTLAFLYNTAYRDKVITAEQLKEAKEYYGGVFYKETFRLSRSV